MNNTQIRYTLETKQWLARMVESEDGEWVKADDAIALSHPICNLWPDPIEAQYVVDRLDHPPSECFPVYRVPQPLRDGDTSAQLIITQLRNKLAAMTAKRNDWEALTKIVRDVYKVSITDSPPAANNICELLATLIHFIPANEPELIKDTMAMCHDIRNGIAAAKEPTP